MDGVAETLDAFGKAEKDFEGMDLIEEVGAELAVGALGFKYMIDGDGQGMGDGNEGLLLAAPGGDTPVLSAEVALFLSDGAMGGFNNCGSQGPIAFASFSAFALARALVLSGAESDPGGKVMLVGKTAHVGACFGDNDLSHSPIDAWSAIKPIDVIILFAQKGFDMGIQLGDLGNENCDGGEKLLNNESVMRSQVSAQSLLQLGDLGAQPTLGQLGQFLGITLASYQFLKHFGRRDSGDIGDHALEFDVCALQGLLQLVGGLSPLAGQRAAVAGSTPASHVAHARE